ncbi:MAG TPA: zinc-ribbon domain-containing protein [Flavobacteriaceae bacterium]|nr:TerB family tellurite resistance protein [Flavobacteriaceae bacterium]MCB9213008.1 TerB family tellurite resistance protein [Alteromonas sp.]HPF10913.1 zinc-ribbon domain-containing protein [Flavobacteriaceae bacterium]HQU20345.1 zinc-ribbon domain-containing protein [Flavobacteriaceae bacterium]HQU64237.1 zinc-ribbon domain-containing protein [Flavobacteriaceae bacterium]
MFIIFGTRGIKHQIKESEVLSNACPNCNNGDLIHKRYRRWFTLFFIPVIPLDSLDRFYECSRCRSAYKESIKNILQQSKGEIEENQRRARLAYAKALIASMTHMAVIDDHLAKEEEREIMDAIENFDEFKAELMDLYEAVKTHKNKDNIVFNYLNEARELLSSETIINILAQAAIILLADGSIEEEEEQLMKEYLIACGLPKDFYHTLLEKLQKKDVSKLKEGQLN